MEEEEKEEHGLLVTNIGIQNIGLQMVAGIIVKKKLGVLEMELVVHLDLCQVNNLLYLLFMQRIQHMLILLELYHL